MRTSLTVMFSLCSHPVMPQYPSFPMVSPLLRQRPQWPARASWQVARVPSIHFWLRSLHLAWPRIHALAREVMMGGIIGIGGGWTFAWLLLRVV